MILNLFSQRYQRTIIRPVDVRGSGFLTGAQVHLHFQPAPPDTGIVFVRSDVQPRVIIPARVDQVTGTERRTTLGQSPAQVTLVEHVLAALAGLRIDNCQVELNAAEPPGLDGSAQGFVQVLQRAGTVLQPARRSIWSVAEPVTVGEGGACLTLYPASDDEFRITYMLDFGPSSPIDRQTHTQAITPQNMANEIAAARTFVLEHEALEFRRQGLGRHLSTADLLIVGSSGPINNRYRHGNELARHKMLDIVGDLSLLGSDLRGHLVAYRSGHPLNIELLRVLTGVAQSAQLQAA